VGEFRVSDNADEDLIRIYMEGHQQFGPLQAVKYQLELDHCFSLLADQPRMGRSAERIAPGVRRHEHGSHVILYREQEDGVLILAVVHGRSVRGLKV
jgi:toxin ParE1/3/4